MPILNRLLSGKKEKDLNRGHSEALFSGMPLELPPLTKRNFLPVHGEDGLRLAAGGGGQESQVAEAERNLR